METSRGNLACEELVKLGKIDSSDDPFVALVRSIRGREAQYIEMFFGRARGGSVLRAGLVCSP